MGAGKSTIGKHLARITGYKFIDLDNYIEQKRNMGIPEIFEKEGKEAFRAEELASLQEIVSGDFPERENGKNLILALGGGTVTTEACARIVKEQTHCIYLYCATEELVKRLARNHSNRPLLSEKSADELEEHIKELVRQREEIYKSCAKDTVDTGNKKLQDVIDDILNRI